jgi:hypothetical protein
MWSFVWKRICAGLFIVFVIYLLSLEIQLSKGKGWNPINRFNPATLLCRSKTRIMVFHVHISMVERTFNNDGHQFHQYQQNERSLFILTELTEYKEDHNI